MQYTPTNTTDKIQLICNRIDEIRKDSSLSQKQFAGMLNISQSAVSKYLTQRIPPADIMLKIARIGNTTIEWILTGNMSYKIIEENLLVSENKNNYRTQKDLSEKIAQLPSSVRTAILTLIDFYNNQRK